MWGKNKNTKCILEFPLQE